MNIKIYLLLSLIILLSLAACTATLPQGDIVFNFCDVDENEYIDCPTISLSTDTITMTIEVTSSDVASVDSVVFELPEEYIYCSTDPTTLTTTDKETYTVELLCDLSGYEEQNTQLAFTVTATLTDGSTVSITGDAEDWIE